MIVKTTDTYHKIYCSFAKRGIRQPNGGYFNYRHKVLNQDDKSYDITDYPINRNKETEIPDEIANLEEFQVYLTQGYLQEIS